MKTEKVVVGTASATLASAVSKPVSLTLNATGKALLAKAHHLKLTVTVSAAGKVLKTYTTRLTARKATAVTKQHKQR